MLNTSFQPMISHLFNNPFVKEMLNQCAFNTLDLTKCLTTAIDDQFQNLNKKHHVKCAGNVITIFEYHTDEDTPETYTISLCAYPEEITGISKEMTQAHDLLLFFTQYENSADLNEYLQSLDDYGAPLKAHLVNIQQQPSTIQILEKYYDFNVGTFNDYK